MSELKANAARGGLAKLLGEGVNFGVRLIYLVLMARLLDPADFGLVAMVTVITGFFSLFTTAGLSTVTVQRDVITDEQISTLFWANILVGIALAALCLLTAPVLVRFYNEPRLFWIMVTMAAGFLISAAAVQHFALLQRSMRFVTVAVIEAASQFANLAVGLGAALVGFGYWSLVVSTIASQVVVCVSVWIASAWIPGRPRRRTGIRSMLRFGGIVTLNSLVVYVAYNFEKLLLGRFWGADALGLYGRAYQLINIPTQALNSAIGGVTFATLSRLQNDPTRLGSYFLKSYRLANSLTLPITLFSAVFADEIIHVVLGPKWSAAVLIFRLLSPTILVFGIINPTAWLLYSLGLQVRSLQIALVIAPLVMTAYIIGLPYGSAGVALAYSTAMIIWVVPHLLWCLHGTPISPWDVLGATGKPLVSAFVATTAAYAAQRWFGPMPSQTIALALEMAVMSMTYGFMLLFVMGEKTLYLDLWQGLTGSRSNREP